MTLNILFHSTVPWSPSSYSILTNRTVPNIVKDGHKVTLSTWYGLQGGPLPWNIWNDDKTEVIETVTVLPFLNGGSYGTDTMVASYIHHKSNILITNSDVWVYPPDETRKVNFAPWFPVDYDPVPDQVLNSLSTAFYPMCYSKFGVRVLEDAGLKTHYVPCGADSKVYNIKDRDAARARFQVPDNCEFLITMVAANKDPNDRKGFGVALPAFAKFLETHPNSYLYLHTNWNGPITIPQMVSSLGIQDFVLQPDHYAYMMGLIGEDYMVDLYNASDVLLNPCKSEGFGLPLVEAQMCGCPIAVTDFSTTEELFSAGWRLQGQPDWASGLNSWRVNVHLSEIVSALEDAHSVRGNDKFRKKARKGVVKFDNDNVYRQYWRPALKEMEDILSSTKLQVPGLPVEIGVNGSKSTKKNIIAMQEKEIA